MKKSNKKSMKKTPNSCQISRQLYVIFITLINSDLLKVFKDKNKNCLQKTEHNSARFWNDLI